ncbi:phosphotransferase [Kitasatospora sp. LaBMicrA B282]|uniref:phosphotransferase n=1 Tax=Kitasatospora sp. LaBMicrA B282 TaxID=3420949 RepID=UPI003D0F0F02
MAATDFGVVGSQGCHAVYEGEDEDSRPVAIRAVCLDAEQQLHRRLETELASLAHLSGTGPAPAVLANGQDDKLRYLVTQWLPGQTWRAHRKEHDARQAHRLLPAAAFALAALHRCRPSTARPPGTGRPCPGPWPPHCRGPRRTVTPTLPPSPTP